VHDALSVRLAHRVADLQRHVHRPRQRHRALRGRERAQKRDAVQVLHHDVQLAAREAAGRGGRPLTRHQDLDHVRVGEAVGHARLAQEAGDERGVRAQLAVQDLHRDIALHALLEAAVDAAHGPDADELAQLDLVGDARVEVGVFACLGVGGAERRAVLRAEERVALVLGAARRAHPRGLGHPAGQCTQARG
jgi:hypothetical protein